MLQYLAQEGFYSFKVNGDKHSVYRVIDGVANRCETSDVIKLNWGDDVIRQIEIGCATSLMDDNRAARSSSQPASEADAFDLEAFIEGDNLEPGKLRPCPFCGGEAERIDFDEDDDKPENVGGSAITCKRCKCSTAVVFGYKETLFSSWNERAPANARAALKGVPQPATPKEAAMTEAQIKHMVDRFLMWKLPEHFNPDDGISFDPVASKGTPYEFRRSPSGTNLFSAEQATAMVRHMLESLPQPASEAGKLSTGEVL